MHPVTQPDPHASAFAPQALKNGAIVSTWWDAASGWQSTWFEVPGGGATQAGSQITTVARDANHLDLFVVGTDGKVHSTYWNSTGGWSSGWFPLPGVTATQGATLTAIARTPNTIDLFLTDVTGGCAWTHWSSAVGWASWTELAGDANPGSPIAAVARGANRIDLFCIGKNGVVYSRESNSPGGWTGWLPNPGPTTPPGSVVTAIVSLTDYINLYVTDSQGSVILTTYYLAPSTSNQWSVVPGGGTAKPGSPVSAVARDRSSGNLFVTGTDGRIYTTFWQPSSNPGKIWSGVWSVIGGVTAPLGSPITAISRNPNHLDVFVADVKGNICSTWWDASTGWTNGWFVVPGGSGVKPGSPVTVISRNPNHLDLFVAG